MSTNILSKPVTKDPFESVSFVNEPHMTHHRLKMVVKNIWKQFHNLANHLENTRPDISHAIDHILDGNEAPIFGIRQRFSYYLCKNMIIVHDGIDNSIHFIDKNGQRMPKIVPCDENDLKNFLNQ